MKIVVVAAPGGGKTTIMNYVKKRKPDVVIVNFGDYMFDIAKMRFGIEDRDEMRRKIPVDQYRSIQEEAARRIAELKGDVLIDTHAAIKKPEGFYPGLPDYIVSIMKPDVILLFEFDPHTILQRRMKDIRGEGSTLRTGRDLESAEEIEAHQQANRYFAFAAANASGCTVKIVDLRFKESHPFEHAEVGAEEIIKLLEGSGSPRIRGDL
ncbi:MAG: adenylate kinase [Nitrososphaerota archaeon]|nr:adenylate kinase [Candidatus Bathyarchaeota archaeon]MCX8162274.1 adenylate kinase [Candidatus Bathyarchaeota archaeon]MDW8061396.1 adenylate kinase [Nitrososphaerota archaeon]